MIGIRQRLPTAVLLIGLPLLSNVASFVIFAPVFASKWTITEADFQRAGLLVGVAIVVIEFIAFLLIVGFLRRENRSLESVINFQRNGLRTYLFVGLTALLPTAVAGWLYSQAQIQAGVVNNFSQLSLAEISLWYVITPISAAFFEEIIWRGYTIPRLQGIWRGLLFSSLSFALFHGIFNPLAVVASFLQGLVWGWVYRRTDSTVPSMVLHFLSRYLIFAPGL
ncbi:MAG: type II CAAX endopeptidase family protein [Anaerolineales bacterium]|jgi:membrane protease YdiL (CAAX protease family)